MKQVYVTKQGLHWASNGSMVGGAFIDLESDGKGQIFLVRVGFKRQKIEVVTVPRNRCKNCGEKQ